jgi:hypothetical protein
MPVDAGSPLFGEIPGNNTVSALISNSSTIGDSGVSKALNWVLILRNGRKAFAPGLDPRVFARPF